MRWKWVLIALPVTALSAAPTLAATPQDIAAMAAQCRGDGAGPWEFGTALPGAPAVSFNVAPFESALARTTFWSDRVTSVEFAVTHKDETIGKAQEQALVAAFEQVGWVRAGGPTNFDIGIVLFGWNHVLLPPGYSDPAIAPVFAKITWYPKQLRLVCRSAEWTRRHFAEVNDNLIEGSLRPAPLPAITAVRPTLANCDDPDYMDRSDKMFGAEAPDAWVFQMEMRKRQIERLEIWVRWKLRTQGGLSDQQVMDLIKPALSPEIVERNARAAPSHDLSALANKVQAAQDRNDKVALCPLQVRLADVMAAADELLLDRWARIEPIYLAEAVAAGVDLSR